MLSENILFCLFASSLITSSALVVLSRNTIVSLLSLVGSYILASFILFLLECEFLALIFITVYVGAIAVFFLFAVMMLDHKQAQEKKGSIRPLAASVSLGLGFFFFFKGQTKDPYMLQLLEFNCLEESHSHLEVQVYGQVLYTSFVLQFLLVGLILLLALVGSIYLTHDFKKKSKITDQEMFKQIARLGREIIDAIRAISLKDIP